MRVETPELFFVKLGSGKKTLLLFHGFGQDHAVFLALANQLSSQYTCYIFDLYFHGQSRWHADETPLEKNEWKSLVTNFLTTNNIAVFSLLGYSLGAKFAFATLEALPDRTRELILIAPDAVKTSTWYSLATYPLVLRKLFKSMINHHSWFLGIARTLRRLGALDKGVIRFAEQQMNTEEKRKRVYYSWVVFRHLQFDMKKIASLINRFSISLTVFTGKHDRVIRTENMRALLDHVSSARSEVIEAGHNNLINNEALFNALKA
jgi:pimeloyl-ACP methyl ester carboxylesterase